MTNNMLLRKAKSAKKDEFYTQLEDIEKELVHYRPLFKGKVVFCNCDDPYESNFFKYFALNFNYLGLKKLIATCYVHSQISEQELSLYSIFEHISPEQEPGTIKCPYKIEITEVADENGDGRIDIADVEHLIRNKKNILTLLNGNGDFRSQECIELLKEADIVCTNPPFSLFREYVAQLIEYNKKFLIIGDLNAQKYKDIFPLIQSGKMWAGYGFNLTMIFRSPYENKVKSNRDFVKRKGYDPALYLTQTKICWYTNSEVSQCREELVLYKHYSPKDYHKYDNFDAIEVSKINDIPCDYDGLMGVPLSFLGKYNPNQFEIIGCSDLPETMTGISELGQDWIEKYRKEGGTGHYTAGMKSLGYSGNGKNKVIFSRLIIKRRI